jgi:hypothetical protein
MEGLDADGGADAFGAAFGLKVVAAGEKDEEFLPAIAAGDVVEAGGAEDAAADFAKDGVPGEMAVGIIDRLKVVDIEKQDAEGGTGAEGALDFLVEEVEESGAIPEAGEGVVGRLVAELLLGDEEIVLSGEKAGEGLTFFVGRGFGLSAEGAGFVELGLNLTGLSGDAMAESQIAGKDDEEENAEEGGEEQGVAGRPPGRGAEDLDVVGGAQEEVEGLGSFRAVGVNDADAAEAQGTAGVEGVEEAGGGVGGEHGKELLTGVGEQKCVEAVPVAGVIEEEGFEFDGVGVVGAGKGLGGGELHGRGQGSGAEAADEGLVKVRSVVAVGGEADNIDAIAGAEGSGILGGDKDAVVVFEEGEVPVVEGRADQATDMNAVAGPLRGDAGDVGDPNLGEGEGVGGSGGDYPEAGEAGHVEQDAGELAAQVEAAADGGAETDASIDKGDGQRAGPHGNPDIEAFFAGGHGDLEASAAGLRHIAGQQSGGADDALDRDPAGIPTAGGELVEADEGSLREGRATEAAQASIDDDRGVAGGGSAAFDADEVAGVEIGRLIGGQSDEDAAAGIDQKQGSAGTVEGGDLSAAEKDRKATIGFGTGEGMDLAGGAEVRERRGRRGSGGRQEQEQEQGKAGAAQDPRPAASRCR